MKKKTYEAPAITVCPAYEMPALLADTKIAGGSGNSSSGGGWSDDPGKDGDFEWDDEDEIQPTESADKDVKSYFDYFNKRRNGVGYDF